MHIVDFPLLPDLATAATQSVATVLKGYPDLSYVAQAVSVCDCVCVGGMGLFCDLVAAATQSVATVLKGYPELSYVAQAVSTESVLSVMPLSVQHAC